MKLKHLFIPLTGLALTSLASPSYAGDNGPGWDYKTHNGSQCQSGSGSQVGDFTFDGNGIWNINPSYRSVTCPIVRDSVSPTALDASVTVRSYGGKPLDCWFLSRDAYGGLVSYVYKIHHGRCPNHTLF